MMHLRQSMRAMAVCMAIVMLMTSLPFNFARAAMVTTDQVVAQAEVDSDRARVIRFMAREDVRQQLEALGIDPDEATRRTESLSDDEIQQIAERMDELPAGRCAGPPSERHSAASPPAPVCRPAVPGPPGSPAGPTKSAPWPGQPARSSSAPGRRTAPRRPRPGAEDRRDPEQAARSAAPCRRRAPAAGTRQEDL